MNKRSHSVYIHAPPTEQFVIIDRDINMHITYFEGSRAARFRGRDGKSFSKGGLGSGYGWFRVGLGSG